MGFIIGDPCPHRTRFFCLHLSQRLLPGVLATGIVACVGTHQRDQDHTVVRDMTQNMFEDTDFERLSAATTPAQFVAAGTGTFKDIADEPGRTSGGCHQRVSQTRTRFGRPARSIDWRTGATPPATTVKSDLRPLLLDELDKRHEPYTLVAVGNGTSQHRVPNLVPILGRAGHVCQGLTPCNSPRLLSTPRNLRTVPPRTALPAEHRQSSCT